ncbi:DUF445 domain-containing protein [Janthinobacterium psychrotolerans]|uniref:Putative membrane-anchored protein YjiN, DUF445 family n=1 Tax=Janthinobacterium psychrotolerans TaxID=1747903 RepID=A0A1A7BWH0_9BURK|nr:DUF445 domain-containing protein [Janthinobacterium psychrotolerans]OBV37931.1 putative membrane-anchored protein YjiN, DUF445 family [Janthinobacterium psychrotolerans]
MPPAPILAEPRSADQLKRDRLRTMQWVAVGLLLAAALLFALARSQRASHPAWGYLEAFAEASMVGAIADWFAVVALFRHPLGIPVWHTAIIPNSKDSIGQSLGAFVENHFITEQGIAERIAQADPAELLGAWLRDPLHAQQLGQSSAGVAKQLLSMLDHEHLRELVRSKASAYLGQLNLSSVAADCIDALIADGKPQELLDFVLDKGADYLADESHHAAIGDFALNAFHIENKLVKAALVLYEARMIRSLQEFVVAVRADAQHPVRSRLSGWIGDSALHLKNDPRWQDTVRQYQQQALASDKVQAMLGEAWDSLVARLQADLDSEQPALARAIARLAGNTGKVLGSDATARQWLNDTIVAGSSALVRRYRGEVGAFIESRLALWSKDEMSERIELAIGRDLQFIRINGTVVGGLAGLLIHTVSQAF